MKVCFLSAFFFVQSVSADTLPGSIDWIHDDYNELTRSTFHSRGFLTYGLQTNTFHVRQFHGRYNYQIGPAQFFFTLRGYKDTHDPAIDYQYVLNNIGLHDYGATFDVYKGFFISLRGAATYSPNYHSFLLLYPYRYETNPAEFDSPAQFLTAFPTGPGIRVGYLGESFEVAYSQGDFRHLIPLGFMARVFTQDWYLRFTLLPQYGDPVTFRPETLQGRVQISFSPQIRLGNGWKLSGIVDATWLQGTWWFRVEEAIQAYHFTLAFRQIFKTATNPLVEISLTREFEELLSAGVYWASSGQTYIGAQVNF